MVAAVAGDFDPRPKLVVKPSFEVLWHSPDAEELLRSPLPIQLDGLRLEFAGHIRIDGVQQFFEDATPSSQTCLLRGESKGHWVLMRAWAIEKHNRW